MSRLSYLDSARGVAILMIVWLHLGWNTNVIQAVVEPTRHASTFGVPMFFMISGFLFSLALAKPGLSVKRVLTGKIKSTLVPFYALSLLFIPLIIINTCLAPNSEKTWESALTALATFDISDSLPSGVLWFLFVLFIFFVFTLAVTRLLGKSGLARPFLWVFSGAILLAFPYLSDITFMGVARISRGYFFFIFGFYGLKYFTEAKFPAWQIALAWAGAIALFVIHFYMLQQGTYPYFILEMLNCLLFNIALLLSCKSLMEKLPRLLGALGFLGTHSMSIFVFHVPVFIFFWLISKKMGIYNKLGTDAVIITLCVLIPLLFEYILAWMPPLHQIFLGRKPIFQPAARRRG